MTKRVAAFTFGLVALLMFQSAGDTQGSKDWNSSGLSPQEFKSMPARRASAARRKRASARRPAPRSLRSASRW